MNEQKQKQNHFLSSYNVSGKCYTEDVKCNSFDNPARKGFVSRSSKGEPATERLGYAPRGEPKERPSWNLN